MKKFRFLFLFILFFSFQASASDDGFFYVNPSQIIKGPKKKFRFLYESVEEETDEPVKKEEETDEPVKKEEETDDDEERSNQDSSPSTTNIATTLSGPSDPLVRTLAGYADPFLYSLSSVTSPNESEKLDWEPEELNMTCFRLSPEESVFSKVRSADFSKVHKILTAAFPEIQWLIMIHYRTIAINFQGRNQKGYDNLFFKMEVIDDKNKIQTFTIFYAEVIMTLKKELDQIDEMYIDQFVLKPEIMINLLKNKNAKCTVRILQLYKKFSESVRLGVGLLERVEDVSTAREINSFVRSHTEREGFGNIPWFFGIGYETRDIGVNAWAEMLLNPLSNQLIGLIAISNQFGTMLKKFVKKQLPFRELLRTLYLIFHELGHIKNKDNIRNYASRISLASSGKIPSNIIRSHLQQESQADENIVGPVSLLREAAMAFKLSLHANPYIEDVLVKGTKAIESVDSDVHPSPLIQSIRLMEKAEKLESRQEFHQTNSKKIDEETLSIDGATISKAAARRLGIELPKIRGTSQKKVASMLGLPSDYYPQTTFTQEPRTVIFTIRDHSIEIPFELAILSERVRTLVFKHLDQRKKDYNKNFDENIFFQAIELDITPFILKKEEKEETELELKYLVNLLKRLDRIINTSTLPAYIDLNFESLQVQVPINLKDKYNDCEDYYQIIREIVGRLLTDDDEYSTDKQRERLRELGEAFDIIYLLDAIEMIEEIE